MSLEKILQALDAEAERLVSEIDQATQAEVERLQAEAQTEAAAVRQKHLTAMKAPLKAEQSRLLNRAKQEALQIVMGTREDLITAALEAAERRLKALPANEARAGLLRRLTAEAVEAFGPNGLNLRVHSGDVAMMERIVDKMGLTATVTGGLEHDETIGGELGGLVATTADGRISLVNTSAVRLKRAAHLYRAQIAAMIFENQQEH